MDYLPIFLLVAFAASLSILFYLNLQSAKTKKQWIPKIRKMVSELDHSFDTQNIQQYKYALIEIDKLLDHVFIKKHIRGETMGERLKNVAKYFERNQYDRIWQAHKARNILAHEVDITISEQKIKEHYAILKSAINQLLR